MHAAVQAGEGVRRRAAGTPPGLHEGWATSEGALSGLSIRPAVRRPVCVSARTALSSPGRVAPHAPQAAARPHTTADRLHLS